MKIYLLAMSVGLVSLSAGASTYAHLSTNDKDGVNLRLQIGGEDAKELMNELKISFPKQVSTTYFSGGEIDSQELVIEGAVNCRYQKFGLSPDHVCYIDAENWIRAKQMKKLKD